MKKVINIFILLIISVISLVSCDYFIPENKKSSGSKPNFLSTTNKIVAAYFEGWKIWKPENNLARHTKDEIDYSIITHLLLAFGDIQYDDYENPTIFWLTTGADLEKAEIDKIISEAHENNVKVILSIGGWNFNDPMVKNNANHNKNLYDARHTAWIFTTMASKPSFRKAFAESVARYLQVHNLDGIDIDWEFPGLPSANVLQDGSGSPYNDYENFPLLLKQIKQELDSSSHKAFDGSHLTLSIAVGPNANKNENGKPIGYKWNEMTYLLDWVGVMAYDFHVGSELKTDAHVPFDKDYAGEFSVKKTVQDYMFKGVPRDKILLGIATYGRGWKGVEKPQLGVGGSGKSTKGAHTGEAGFLSYFEIKDKIESEGYTRYWDEYTQTPFIYSQTTGELIGYEDLTSMAYKVNYIVEQNLAGAYTWALGLDEFDGKEYTMQRTLFESLASGTVNRQLELSSPPDSSVMPENIQQVEIVWQSDLDSFDIYFGRTKDSLALFDSGIKQKQYTLTKLYPNRDYYWRVFGNKVAISPIYGFKTTTVAPFIELVAPTFGDTLAEKATSVELVWESNLTSFDIYFSDEALPKALIADDLITKSFKKTNLALDKKYYWMIIGENGAKSSEVFYFYTRDTFYINLIAPTNGSRLLINQTTADLSWQSNLKGFDVYLGTSQSSLVKIATSVQTTSFTATGLTLDTTYFWQIGSGDFRSSVFSFVAKKIKSPFVSLTLPMDTDSLGFNVFSPTLKWESNLTSFSVYLGENANSLTKIASDLTAFEYSKLDLGLDKKFYWKVIGSLDTLTAQSSVFSFYTRELTTPYVLLTGPINTDTFANDVSVATFKWRSNLVSFDVYLGETPNSLTKIDSNITVFEYTKSNLSFDKKYYWRVVGRVDTFSAQSPLFSFNTQQTDLYSVSLVSPENNSFQNSKTFTWSSQRRAGATGITYDFYLGADTNNLTLEKAGLTDTQYVKSNLEMGKKNYAWRVVAKDTKGVEKSTPAKSFSTKIVLGGYRSWVPNFPSGYNRDNVDFGIMTHMLFEFETYDDATGVVSKSDQVNQAWGMLATARANDVEFIVSVVVNKKEKIRSVLQTSASRGKFINGLKSYYDEDWRNVDGFNINFSVWDYKATAAERDQFSALIKEMRSAFNSHVGRDFIITVSDLSSKAIPDWQGNYNYDWSGFKDSIDFAILSPFALGEWPTNKTNANVDLGDFNSQLNTVKGSISPNKIVYGVATYGLGWYSVTSGAMGEDATMGSVSKSDYDSQNYNSYHKIMDLIASGYVRTWDNASSTPFIYSSSDKTLISYDDEQSLGHKMDKIISDDIGGVYIRSLDSDVFADKAYPLTKFIYGKMRDDIGK